MIEESQKRKVLLIDDDKFLLDMYGMKFTQQGYEVHASLSVRDAIEALRAGFSPTAILFDLIMPERDGFSLLETLEKEHLAPDALKIGLTNETSDVEKEQAKKLGADAYFIKATLIPSEVVNMVGDELIKRNKA